MGKTKTAFVAGTNETVKSGKEAYEERKIKKAAAEQQKSKAQVKGVGLKGGERIKVIGAELPPEEAPDVTPPSAEIPKEEGGTTPVKPKKSPRVRGKKYLSSTAKIDKNRSYPLTEAVKLVKATSYSKFDGTMELHLILKRVGLSAKVTLPHFSGKQKVIEIADDKTVEKLKNGKIDFDILLATSDMMPKLVPFARVLGPKGLMPNPKNGTLIKNAKEADKFKENSLNLKTQKDQPLIHTAFGKLSQDDNDLLENLEAILEGINRKNIVTAYIKATMSPSIKLQL